MGEEGGVLSHEPLGREGGGQAGGADETPHAIYVGEGEEGGGVILYARVEVAGADGTPHAIWKPGTTGA